MEHSVRDMVPKTDIFEKENEYVIRLEMPGVKKEDVQIEIKEDVLSVRAEKKANKEIKEDDYYMMESVSGKFSRSFNIPKGIDEKKVKAKLKDGILELVIIKPEEIKPKEISVSVN